MKHVCAAGAAAGAIVLLITACVEYREEWEFTARGAGRVRITCQPSARWRTTHAHGDWEQMARLFIPPCAALSQACAQAGVRLERCTWRSSARRRPPGMELVIVFDAVPHLARCALFAGRELHWRRDQRAITLLHTVRTYDTAARVPQGGPLPPDWFADGRVTITTRMPGRIVRAEGGRVARRLLTATASLNELAGGAPLEMLIEARLPWPWWRLVVSLTILGVALTVGAWLWWRRRARGLETVG